MPSVNASAPITQFNTKGIMVGGSTPTIHTFYSRSILFCTYLFLSVQATPSIYSFALPLFSIFFFRTNVSLPYTTQLVHSKPKHFVFAIALIALATFLPYITLNISIICFHLPHRRYMNDCTFFKSHHHTQFQTHFNLLRIHFLIPPPSASSTHFSTFNHFIKNSL